MQDKLSVRQMMVLLATAVLMPTTALLPTLTAQMAGSAGWLSLAGALPVLLCACWAGDGVGRGVETFPSALRNVYIIICMGWVLFVMMVSFRLSAARLAEVYGERMALFCVVGLLFVSVWMGFGKVSALARAAEIFYLALAVLLVGVVVLAAVRMEKANFHVEAAELAALPKSSFAAAGILLNVYPASVLSCKVVHTTRNCRKVIGWIAAFSAAAALLIGATIGCLGPALTGKIPSPFLVMVQGLGIKGAFQRAEALIIAIWTLSDLVLIGLQLHTWKEYVNLLKKGNWGRKSMIPAAVIAFAAAWVVLPAPDILWQVCRTILPALGLIFGVVLPILLWFGIKIRRAV